MSRSEPSQPGPLWRRPGVLLVVAALSIGLYLLLTIGADTKRLEQLLIDQFGAAENYLPPADGQVASTRIEKFILVRQAIQGSCLESQAILDDIIAVAEMEADQDMPATEKLAQGVSSIKGILNAAPNFLAFMKARNTALLEHGVGLGEYLYLYLSAYGPQLALEERSRYAGIEEAFISSRTRGDYASILTAQLSVLESAEPLARSRQALAADLERQIEALEDVTDRSPWPFESMGVIVPTLKPYEKQLFELYCDGVVQTELKQKNNLVPLRG